jgi:hypothetical protein
MIVGLGPNDLRIRSLSSRIGEARQRKIDAETRELVSEDPNDYIISRYSQGASDLVLHTKAWLGIAAGLEACVHDGKVRSRRVMCEKNNNRNKKKTKR